MPNQAHHSPDRGGGLLPRPFGGGGGVAGGCASRDHVNRCVCVYIYIHIHAHFRTRVRIRKTVYMYVYIYIYVDVTHTRVSCCQLNTTPCPTHLRPTAPTWPGRSATAKPLYDRLTWKSSMPRICTQSFHRKSSKRDLRSRLCVYVRMYLYMCMYMYMYMYM